MSLRNIVVAQATPGHSTGDLQSFFLSLTALKMSLLDSDTQFQNYTVLGFSLFPVFRCLWQLVNRSLKLRNLIWADQRYSICVILKRNLLPLNYGWLNKPVVPLYMEILLSNRKKDRSMQPHGLSSNGWHERSQTAKATHWMIQLTWHSGKSKMIRTEDKSLVAKGWIERLTAKRSEGKLFFMMELF